MKERIVIDNEDILFSCLHDYEDNVGVINYKLDRKKVEKYPTSWEELKELCRKLKIGDCEVYITLQLTDKMKLYFYDNGEIIGAYLDFEYEFSLAKGRTPQQMWQIIKNLIGEE